MKQTKQVELQEEVEKQLKRLQYQASRHSGIKNTLLNSVKEEILKSVAQAQQEAVDSLEFKKTLVAVPKGYKFIEVTSLGKIITKPIKDIKNGSTIKTIYFDESLQKEQE